MRFGESNRKARVAHEEMCARSNGGYKFHQDSFDSLEVRDSKESDKDVGELGFLAANPFH